MQLYKTVSASALTGCSGKELIHGCQPVTPVQDTITQQEAFLRLSEQLSLLL